MMPWMKDREMDGMGRYGDPKKADVSFTPPSGLELDGASGEALVKWKRDQDGKIRIESMNGVSLAGGGPDSGPEEEGDDYEPSG